MNRSLQCIRNDCDECIGCDCTCHPVVQTWDRFVVLTRLYAEMMQHAESRTEQILKRMKHRGWLKHADEYGATIEYNGACHCHPEPKEFKLPAGWLFADDWQAKVDEYTRQLETKRLAAEAAIDRRRQAEEREYFETLKAKYGNAITR